MRAVHRGVLSGPGSAAVTRVAGAERVETAERIARAFFDDADRMVLASRENWPDAVVGANLSAVYDAPVLLTPKEGDLTVGTFDYLCPRLTADDSLVWLLGGVAAVGVEVEVSTEQDLHALCPTGPGPVAQPTLTPSDIVLRPESDAARVINAAGPGETFYFRAGRHELSEPISLEQGQRFIGEVDEETGEPLAILSGARPIEGWFQQGESPVWCAGAGTEVAGGQHGQVGNDDPSDAFAAHVEDVYYDGEPLDQVAHDVTPEPGEFLFVYAEDSPRTREPGTVCIGRSPDAEVRISLIRAALTVDADLDNTVDAAGIDNGTISHLKVEGFANPAQHGAIDLRDTKGWTVQAVQVRRNHGVGVYLGRDTRLADSVISGNGQLGVGANGDLDLRVNGAPVPDNITIAGNEIAGNNWAGYSRGWEAGGVKLTRTVNVDIIGNHVYDNDGVGLWIDIDARDTLYQRNVVNDNRRSGIHHEVSLGANILNNYLGRNGVFEIDLKEDQRLLDTGEVDAAKLESQTFYSSRAGILVASSGEREPRPGEDPNTVLEQDILVEGNRVRENRHGIALTQQERCFEQHDASGYKCMEGTNGQNDTQHILNNVVVRANRISMTRGQNGVATDWGQDHGYNSTAVFTRDVGSFDDNQYLWAPCVSEVFTWNHDRLTPSGWRQAGQDANGIFTSTVCPRNPTG